MDLLAENTVLSLPFRVKLDCRVFGLFGWSSKEACCIFSSLAVVFQSVATRGVN